MKVFYTHPELPGKVALVNTTLSIEQLKELGVLTNDSKYLIDPVEGELMTHSISCVKFDDPNNPTVLIFDVDAIQQKYLEQVRYLRTPILDTLDFIQQRAITLGNTDAATLIEADKEMLRNLTDNLDYSTITEIKHIYTRMPAELLVDYADKYSYV